MEQRFSDVIIRLANGISQRRMYFDAHPRVIATSREVAADITALLRDTDSDTLAFGVFGGKFVRNGRYLVGPSIAGRALIDFAERLGCGGFAFRAPVTPEDLTTFFRLGAERGEPFANLAEAQSAFVASGLPGVTLAAPLVEDNGETPAIDGGGGHAHDAQSESGAVGTADFATLVHIYQAMYDTVACNALAVLHDGSVDFDRARSAGAGLVDLADRNALDVMQFLRYPDYDSYTIGHSVRVAALSAMVARELGWPPDALAELATAGLLHDVGKGRIPAEILFKPGRLDDDERRVIETHPAVGARILLDSRRSQRARAVGHLGAPPAARRRRVPRRAGLPMPRHRAGAHPCLRRVRGPHRAAPLQEADVAAPRLRDHAGRRERPTIRGCWRRWSTRWACIPRAARCA
jgi:putative nucleotidyltransferase with HDIG domain